MKARTYTQNKWHVSADIIIWSAIIFYGLNEVLPYDQIALRYMTCAAFIIPSLFTRSRFLFYVPRLMICAVTEFSQQVLAVMIRRTAMMMFMFGFSFFMAFFISNSLMVSSWEFSWLFVVVDSALVTVSVMFSVHLVYSVVPSRAWYSSSK